MIWKLLWTFSLVIHFKVEYIFLQGYFIVGLLNPIKNNNIIYKLIEKFTFTSG